ncbi:hypothetical protein HID58_081422, partial [Brassica napus]
HKTSVPGVCHSTFQSPVLVVADSLNFKEDSEFMGITVLFLDEKMWLVKSVLSRALTSPKKQLES